MNAIEYINKNLDPRQILEYYGFKRITETQDSIRSSCAIHGGNNPTAFCWNKSNNLWYCYTGDCGGGDVFTLVEKIENKGFKQAVNKVAEILGLDITNMNILIEDRIKKENKLWIQKQLKQHSDDLSFYELPYTKYYEENEKFNRFDNDILKFYDSKFCNIYPTEIKLLKDKLVIPLIFKETLIGVALRTTTNELPKWYYEPKGLKLGNTLYNYDIAKKTIEENNLSEIILTEGIFDVWAFHRIGIDNVVAIYGSHISKEQRDLIIELGVDIVTSFDNDEAGIKARDQANKMFNKISKVKSIELQKNYDPADMSKEDLMSAYLAKA